MKKLALELRQIIASFHPLLAAISQADSAQKPLPEKWSKKEIIGHLIDSASNNHQKFMRAITGEQLHVVGYRQEEWVTTQEYQQAEWMDLLDWWKYHNLHLAHLMEHAPSASMGNILFIDGEGPFTLEFIMKDYVAHLKHHLKQVLPEIEFDIDDKI